MRMTSGLETLQVPHHRVPVETKAVYLHPGQSHVAVAATKVTTIVGSCIAVVLWDARFCIGGVTHYMLPDWSGSGPRTARYGDIALAELLREMQANGARPVDIKAWVYGGGCMLSSFQNNATSLGARNIEKAQLWLKANPQIHL